MNKELKDKLIVETYNYITNILKGIGAELPPQMCKIGAYGSADWHIKSTAEKIVTNILSQTESKGEGWVSVDKAITGKTVIAWYKNSLGKKRVVRATYYEKYHLQVEDWDDIDEEWCDYANGVHYIPEGWYETNESDEKCIKIEYDVLGWQPLPKAPHQKDGK
jgi:hypothetical protein